MTFSEKYDKVAVGIISGLLLPFLTGFVIFLFSSKGYSLHGYLVMIQVSEIITHTISLCVFPNVVIFILFNRYDMLRALKGVLGITIVWAIVVFAIKFLT
jgi:hypothetical protein